MENFDKIMMEAIEIIFVLGNQMEYFGESKVMDLMEQIIPSAYVYGTSYWVYYAMDHELVCICKNYNLPCKHNVQDVHCLDLSLIEEVHNDYLYHKMSPGAILPSYVDVRHKLDLSEGTVNSRTYLLLEHVCRAEGETKILRSFSFELVMNFSVTMVVEPIYANYVFFPHPHSCPQYGTFVTKLAEHVDKQQIYYSVPSDKFADVTLYPGDDTYSITSAIHDC